VPIKDLASGDSVAVPLTADAAAIVDETRRILAK